MGFWHDLERPWTSSFLPHGPLWAVYLWSRNEVGAWTTSSPLYSLSVRQWQHGARWRQRSISITPPYVSTSRQITAKYVDKRMLRSGSGSTRSRAAMTSWRRWDTAPDVVWPSTTSGWRYSNDVSNCSYADILLPGALTVPLSCFFSYNAKIQSLHCPETLHIFINESYR